MSTSKLLGCIGLAILLFVAGYFLCSTANKPVTASETDPATAIRLAKQGNFDEALSILDFSKAIRWNPESYSAYGGRAKAYASLGNYSQARRDLDTAMGFDVPAEERSWLEELSKSIDSQYQFATAQHQQRPMN